MSGSSATFPLTKTQSVNFRRWFADFDLAVGLSSVFLTAEADRVAYVRQ